jgi:hypothetical protein
MELRCIVPIKVLVEIFNFWVLAAKIAAKIVLQGSRRRQSAASYWGRPSGLSTAHTKSYINEQHTVPALTICKPRIFFTATDGNQTKEQAFLWRICFTSAGPFHALVL